MIMDTHGITLVLSCFIHYNITNNNVKGFDNVYGYVKGGNNKAIPGGPID